MAARPPSARSFHSETVGLAPSMVNEQQSYASHKQTRLTFLLALQLARGLGEAGLAQALEVCRTMAF
jgi:hypothetical protein